MESKTHPGAVVVAALAHFALGSVWYSTLSRAWLEGIGKTEAQLMAEGSTAIAFSTALVANLAIAAALAWLIERSGEATLRGGIRVAALAWLGFVATTMGTNYAFEARPLSLFAINGGYDLIGMLIMGAIVGAWRRRPSEATKGAAAGG